MTMYLAGRIQDIAIMDVAITYLFTVKYLSINYIKYTLYFGHVT